MRLTEPDFDRAVDCGAGNGIPGQVRDRALHATGSAFRAAADRLRVDGESERTQ